jgi:hypothetical protein
MNWTWIIIVAVGGLLWWAYKQYTEKRKDRDDKDDSNLN